MNKFIAYDKKNKAWCNGFDLHSEGKSDKILFEIRPKSEDIEIYQFTGVHDGNGEMIFMGSLCSYYNGRGVYIGVVRYIKEVTAYRLIFSDKSYTDLNMCKVIGHIAESPEIWEGEKVI